MFRESTRAPLMRYARLVSASFRPVTSFSVSKPCGTMRHSPTHQAASERLHRIKDQAFALIQYAP